MKGNIGIFLSVFLMSSCAGSCSCSHSKDEGFKSNVPEEVYKYYENDKYIVGKKIFDYYHSEDRKLPDLDIAVKELPSLTITKDHGQLTIKDKDETFAIKTYSLYVADVNQDNHFDLCYHVYGGQYKDNRDYVKVYDVYHAKYLDIFDEIPGYKDKKNSYYLDLDENNVLCIIEGNENLSFNTLISVNRAARLVKKDKNPNFEWFTFDYKIIGIDMFAVDNIERVFESDFCQIDIFFCGFLKDNVQFPIKSDQIVFENLSEGDFNVYLIIDSFKYDNNRFNAYIDFSKEGNYKIRVSAVGFSEIVDIDFITKGIYRLGSPKPTIDENKKAYPIDWPEFYFTSQNYLIADTSENLISSIGIDNDKTIEIKTSDEYDLFKEKLSSIEDEGKILDKSIKEYPNIDFSSHYIAVTAYYKDGYAVEENLDAIIQEDFNLTFRIYGMYEDKEPVDSQCGVIITYLIVPRNFHTYTYVSDMQYKVRKN